MDNVVKWPNILLKSCNVHTARFLKHVWPFYNIMLERVKETHHYISSTAITFIVCTIVSDCENKKDILTHQRQNEIYELFVYQYIHCHHLLVN